MNEFFTKEKTVSFSRDLDVCVFSATYDKNFSVIFSFFAETGN